MVAQEITAMQNTEVSADELTRAKACLVRQLPLSEAGVAEIALGMLGRTDLGLALDEPTRAAQHFIELDGAAVQSAFKKWLRPQDLVRVSEGPPPG
jgi:zinc protease